MYVELVPDCEQSPQKFQIVHAPTYLLLETNYQLGDYIPASEVYLITQVAGYLSSSASQSEINAIANANLAVAQSATVTQS
ncbi:MAG: hypothetical protein KME57_33590 [Scytonema hyalinum WJT4-NPBG1]|jgi:hypothetical protein|nr:hypothetical protein [Scytonema hyalinum WJT4-NPBG1]